MAYKTIIFEKVGRVGYLTFNRPQAMNAMDLVMMDELGECIEGLHADQELQLLVLKGAGGAFSAGGDVKGMASGGDLNIDGAMVKVERYIKALYTLSAITIAQVNGAAAGLGLSTALACDLVVAGANAKIAMNFITIGLIPDGGGHFFMQERLGTMKAKQVIWKGEVMTGEQAQKMGLVDEIVPAEQLESAVQATVTQLLKSPLQAMIATKMILNGSKLTQLEKILQQEAITQPKMRVTADHKEGVAAFVEKRTPNYTGA
ncbi:enoyl-CoA hydratase-related protein [Kurthia sibirica]|uniref:Enoyl-CoA hydratase n=1 Tax=Kurthia sibirica TaxID=202750 RepID=A0A2U3AJD2_9BACL|nr:enoyl-CoA hydratase-related protein [Kurthia sibirica]PWI24663.1 enoyl-CoA hydratase [Kurthia sibirica]GEK33495.1 enoyl-CoA hydratase [Kurthia sibirica]